MDWNIIGTGIGIVAAIGTLMYTIGRNFKQDVISRMDSMDERVFLLATGKSLREAMIEAKQKQDERTR